MAGIAPAGPVSGIAGIQFTDPNPEAPPEVVTGDPWGSPAGPGYVASPLRYPGQLWSLGYGEYPTLAAPETALVSGGPPADQAGVAGPGTPYFDATPNTHAGPWPHPVTDSHRPDEAAFLREQSGILHADGLDNRKPGLNIAATQDQWAEYHTGPVDGALVGDGGQNLNVSAGWGSTDITSHPANINGHTDWPNHFHRRVAQGKNLPMAFLWMGGAQRPLHNDVHGLQALPVGAGPFGGQDPAYGYGSAGAVLTMPAGEYQVPADPWQPAGPLSAQGLLEGPL